MQFSEEKWRALVTGETCGFWAAVQRAGLRICSWAYRLGAWLRNWALDRGWIRAHRIPGTVIVSIGNLVVGGTGKTPVIIRLAEEWTDCNVAVLSRGYRSLAEKRPQPVVLSKGDGPLQSAEQCGDEPFLIAQRVPTAMVVVGRRRVDAARMAVDAGCNLLLIDDGMQHRQLARDFEVVVMDAEDPFGLGYHLPRGYLREDLSSLRRADLVILNHVKNINHFQLVKEKVAPYTSAPLVGSELQVQGVQTVKEQEEASLMGRKVGIFCGIGMPHKFRQTVQGMGGEIVAELFSGDHRLFSEEAFHAFAEKCASLGAEFLVCTEKDRVKIERLYSSPVPIAWVKVGLQIIAGFEAWEQFVETVQNRIA